MSTRDEAIEAMTQPIRRAIDCQRRDEVTGKLLRKSPGLCPICNDELERALARSDKASG